MGFRRWLLAVTLSVVSVSASAVTTKDMKTGAVTPEQIVASLTGAGVTITNIKITGAQTGIGTFTGGTKDGLAVDAGVIMSTGDIKTAAGPNDNEGTTGTGSGQGDPDLDKLITPLKTLDAVVIEFDVVTSGETFNISYVFASEEYKEYVDSQFNDVFAFFVDGKNIALVPGSSEPVSINTINHKKNTKYYQDNPANSGTFGTSFDGFTTELVATTVVTPATTHHIKLAIADASDANLDSAVFLAQGGISGAPSLVVFPEEHEVLLENNDEHDMNVQLFGVREGETASISADGLGEDSVVTFTPTGDPADHIYKMHMKISPTLMPGTYPLSIRAAVGDREAFGTVLITVDCQPPQILSTKSAQPQSTTVNSGGTAKLSVSAFGTSAFKYQWYRGHSGSTAFPIQGATSTTFTTPAITSPTEFWVRVSNPCGSVDSQTATVSPK